MVPRGAVGGNSLLLRAISSQNKNISFQRKSQINTGFARSGFYLPRKCYFLSHFIHRMKDGSRALSKMSFMHAHTHPISLHCRFLCRSLCLVASHRRTHTSYICTYAVCARAEAFVFRMFPHQRGLRSLMVDSGCACLTSPHCCVRFSHQWRIYLV